MSPSPFRVLFRQFFSQFFASESVTSDIRLRQAIIAVVAFLITPGLMMSMGVYPAFEFARFRAPERILPMTRLMANLFLTFSMVSVGLVGAVVWDSLSFDRRDAMVLGPLPVGRRTIVGAKLAAMAALLAGASLSINLLTAIPFAMVANGPQDAAMRHFVAHLVATSYAALFVFSAIVILRALLGMLARGHAAAALGSWLQFAFVSALLCFFVLLPSATTIVSGRRGSGTVRLAELPAWMPSRYFLAMYEQLRGHADAGMVATGRWTAVATLALAAGAALLTIAAYRRQFQTALSPPASAAAFSFVRLSRGVARAIAGSNRIAQATADFVLATISRNRAQQAPIAINAAIGLTLVIVKLVPQHGDLVDRLRAPATLLAVPMMLAYWTSVGLRASFFVPSELPSSWTFRANAPASTSAYALGTRAAMIGLVAPPAGLVALALAGLVGGWSTAILHTTFVTLVTVVLADFMVFTIGNAPFTQPYRPGHSKLKTRWPLYLFGAYVFGSGLAGLELRHLNDPGAFAGLIAAVAMVAVLLEWAVRRAGRRWRFGNGDQIDEESSVTVLDLGPAGYALQMQHKPAS